MIWSHIVDEELPAVRRGGECISLDRRKEHFEIVVGRSEDVSLCVLDSTASIDAFVLLRSYLHNLLFKSRGMLAQKPQADGLHRSIEEVGDDT